MSRWISYLCVCAYRAECEASIERHRSECDKSRQLTIELEKEKGRVAGGLQTHDSVYGRGCINTFTSIYLVPVLGQGNGAEVHVDIYLVYFSWTITFCLVSGLQDQHTKLKQHVSDIEAALAQRESALVQLNAANMASYRKHDQFDEEQKLKIQQLEEDLSNQTNLCETLQQQVGEEVWGVVFSYHL